MLARIRSAAVLGLDPLPVTVEASFTPGLPAFTVVGLPQNAVREGRERVVAALRHCGVALPPRRITINLAPADVRKEGSGLDLAIAVALLVGAEVVEPDRVEGLGVLGELGLDGRLRPIRGVLTRVSGLVDEGCREIVVPPENLREAEAIAEDRACAVEDLGELIEVLRGERSWSEPAGARTPGPRSGGTALRPESDRADLADVRGQEGPRRALEIAAAGGHNLVFVGPPGSGKTLLARRLPGILPPLRREEAIEVTRIHSVAGLLPEGAGLLEMRPFRAPHHSISSPGLAGGGRPIRPGEISLAHRGILFLDELPEFRPSTLELLRQPLEAGEILLGRAHGSFRFPADFLLVAAMNPCPCGRLGSEGEECICPPALVQRYRSRISGPLLDRIDLHVPVLPVPLARLAGGGAGEDTATVAARVREARSRALARNGGIPNAGLAPAALTASGGVARAAVELFQRAQGRWGLSARGYHRTLRVARTIADLADEPRVSAAHVAEALHFRELDRAVA